MLQWRSIGGLLAVATVPAFVPSAFAQDFTIQPRVSIGYQHYDLEFDFNDSLDVDADYMFGGLGVTAQIGKFFVDLYGQTNLTDAEFSEEFINDGVNVVNREANVDRDELNLTVGYAFTTNITAFGGFKYARNVIEQEFNSDNAVVDDFFADQFIDLENDYLGPFVGAALSLPVANFGTASVSGSLAYLDGEQTVDLVIGFGADQLAAEDVTTAGSAVGYGLGATWTGSLAPFLPSLSQVGYSVGVDYSSYDFEDDDDDIFTETTLRIRTDLKYRF